MTDGFRSILEVQWRFVTTLAWTARQSHPDMIRLSFRPPATITLSTEIDSKTPEILAANNRGRQAVQGTTIPVAVVHGFRPVLRLLLGEHFCWNADTLLLLTGFDGSGKTRIHVNFPKVSRVWRAMLGGMPRRRLETFSASPALMSPPNRLGRCPGV